MSENFDAIIYSDGGCRNHGNLKGQHVKSDDKAAWAFMIDQAGDRVSGSGGTFGATNNQMELTGFIEGMKKAIELGIQDKKINFVLDSQYVLNPITKKWLVGWKNRGWRKADKKPVLNVEMWQEIDRLLPNFTDATFTWTKGHANDEGNNFVDELLNQYMDKM
ncbi:MAG: ribonuclease H [Lactobacillus sp.]|nr:ribonuclease H [Lactobacillus sp.]